MHRGRRAAWVAVCICLVASCTNGDDDDDDSSPTTAGGPPSGEVIDEVTAEVTAGTGGSATIGEVVVDIDGGSISGEGELKVTQIALDESVEVPQGITAVGEAINVTLEGVRLIGPATVTFPVPDEMDGVDQAPVVLWQDDRGALTAQPTTWAPGDETITATLEHFTFGFLGSFDVQAAAKGFASDAANYFTGRSGVTQPSCGDEEAARSSVEVVSDQGDSVKWCFGIEGDQTVLKVANNRRAYAEVAFPETWEVIEEGRYGFGTQALNRLLSDTAAELVRPAGTEVRLVAGGDTLVLAVPDSSPARVEVEMSVVSWLLSGIQLGVEVYGFVASAFGLEPSRFERFVAQLTGSEKLGAWAESAKECLSTFADEVLEQPLSADLAWPVLKFVWGCVPDMMRADITATSGTTFFLGFVLHTVGFIVSAVLTAVNLIVSGIREIFDEIASFGGDDDAFYDIVIGGALPDAAPIGLGPVGTLSAAPTVMLVMDTSGSMSETDSLGNVKIEAARASLLRFLAQADGDTRLGLRTYPAGGTCSTGRLRIPIAVRNTATMDATIRTMTPDGDTPTAEALVAAANDLRAAGSPNGSIVLVSDGESTCGDPCEAADTINASGATIQVNTVTLASSEEGREELRCIAEHTGGRALEAADTDELAAILADLSVPSLTLELEHPDSAIAEVGTSAAGLVEVGAIVRNDSQLRADGVAVRIRFPEGDAAVVSPVRSLGNLEPGTSRRVTWQFQPSVTLVGEDLEFEVHAGGANLTSVVSAEGSIKILDASGRDEAGPLLKDAERNVIMGDSYSVGEGAGDYLEGTDTFGNTCHRSTSTYLMEAFDLEPDWNLACSGATAAQVTSAPQGNVDSQVSQLEDLQSSSGPADAVVLTVGGNDVGFKTLLLSCLLSPVSCTNRIAEHETKRFLDARLGSLPETLWETYLAIDAVLNRDDNVEDRGRRAPIIVLAYPRIFPGARRACSALTTIDQEEMNLGSDVVTRLNGAIEGAVKVARSQGAPAFFVPSVEDAFQPSNTICDGDGAYVRSPETIRLAPDGEDLATLLLAGLTPGRVDDLMAGNEAAGRRLQELFHPNTAGYDAMTRALVRWSLTDAAKAELPPPRDDDGLEVDVAHPGEIAGVVSADATEATLQPGELYTIQGGGFAPGTPVEITLQSSLRVLAVSESDETGTLEVDVVIPQDAAPGPHSLTLSGLDGNGEGVSRSIDVEVSAESMAPWRSGWLAVTAPFVLLLAGAFLILFARPRRAA